MKRVIPKLSRVPDRNPVDRRWLRIVLVFAMQKGTVIELLRQAKPRLNKADYKWLLDERVQLSRCHGEELGDPEEWSRRIAKIYFETPLKDYRRFPG